MEEKIVGNKKEDLPSLDLFHSLISISSLIYRSIYSVCPRSTTPLWFTDKVAGGTVVYRYSTTESLYLFTPDSVRVPGK